MIHLLSTFGFTVLAAVAAAEAPASADTSAALLAADAPARSGLQVVVDPVTGQIIDSPTEAQLEVLGRAHVLDERRSAWDLRSFSLPDGGEGVFLDGWADHSLVVTRHSDGNLRLDCAQRDEHALEEDAIGGDER